MTANEITRRHFFSRSATGVGTAALATLLAREGKGAGKLGEPHALPKAKRVISLFMSGGPSQLDLFDYKPLLNKKHGEELPDSVRKGQRLTGMSGNQASLPLAGSYFTFKQHGNAGTWMSNALPYTAKHADEICVIRSMHTEAINHDPAITFLQTGSQIAGRPSMGAWLSYGLGSANDNLPSFCVLVTKDKGGQPLYARLWGSGFLPAHHQGVQFRAAIDPILYLTNPVGISREARGEMLKQLAELNRLQYRLNPDPAIAARIKQYELAYRMQASVPEVTNFADEPKHIFDLYGKDAKKPGTFAANCLLARRLAERGVRFIQLYHQGWDQHGNCVGGVRSQSRETDQASAALLTDLKQRGMLDDTILLWGGEFGRTNYSQGKLTRTNYGRDHHPRCFSMWAAGGGFRPGITYGATDDFGYNIARNPVHVHDLHATVLHLLGIDHERLTYKHQGRRYRLTDVHGKVIKDLIA